jgi:anti-anti-sigma factor
MTAATIEELLSENDALRRRVAELEASSECGAQRNTRVGEGGDAEQLRRVLEATNDGIWDWQIATGEVYYSPRWQAMLGYQPGELAGHVSTWENMLHPEDRARVLRVVTEHMQTHSPSFETEFRMRMKSGGWKWIQAKGKVFEWDEQGQATRMIGTHTDISERKRMEEVLRKHADALQSANMHLERILATMPLAVIVSDTDTVIQQWNASAERIFGWKREEVEGKRSYFDCIIPPHEQAIIRRVIEDMLAGRIVLKGGSSENRNQNITRDGRLITCQWYNSLIHDNDGNIIGLMSLGNDITEQIRMEEERAAFQEQLIEAQRTALRELSAPLLPISDAVVLLPLIGGIDTHRAQQIMDTLLDGVARYRSDVAILDITGVSVVDTQVANVILHAAQAVQLLGAQVVLTGIGPAMARTLVGLGADLGNVTTRGSLQSGIAYAMKDKMRKKR